MSRLIRSISLYPDTHRWHVIGDDSKKLQYVFKWADGSDTLEIKRLRHYGNGGVNSSTGESWGEPSVWENLPTWEIAGMRSMWRRDKREALAFVESLVCGYVEEFIAICWADMTGV